MCGRAPCSLPVCDWSQAHMQACEARYIISLPRDIRIAFYERATKVRGPEAVEQLKQRVKAEWLRQREAA